MHRLYKILFYLAALLLPIMTFAQRQMEYLNRGIVAMPDGKGNIFVSWRLLATDPADIAFYVYRSIDNGKASKLNTPITTATGWIDEKTDPAKTYTYQISHHKL